MSIPAGIFIGVDTCAFLCARLRLEGSASQTNYVRTEYLKLDT
jgi:hypothetical protein